MVTEAVPGSRLLVVDDDAMVRDVLRVALGSDRVRVDEAASSSEALAWLRDNPTDLIVSDYAMQGMNGLHLLAGARKIDPTVGFILLTGMASGGIAVEALRQGADDYILKPFDVDEIRHAVFRTLHHRRLIREHRVEREGERAGTLEQVQEVEGALVDALLAIAGAVAAREGYTAQHIERVTQYAVATAQRMGLDVNTVRQLWIGGMLHDIGKIGIPDEILRKPARLTPEEDEIMKRHPVIGAGIVQRSDFLRPALPAVLHHHERWDGAGYPDGLSGDDIPIAGRILGVVEAFDAIVTPRPYQGKRTRSEAVSELRRCAGGQFDPAVVDAFIRSFAEVGPDVRITVTPPLGEPRQDVSEPLPNDVDRPLRYGSMDGEGLAL